MIPDPWTSPDSVVEKFHATWARERARQDPDNARSWHGLARAAEKNANRALRDEVKWEERRRQEGMR